MCEGKYDKLIVGEDKIKYPRDCGTPMADLLTVKLFLNRVISTLIYKFVTSGIENFYINTPMARYKYIRLKLNNFLKYFIKYYGINEKAMKDGWLYIKLRKVMYRFQQAGILAQQL